MSGGYQAREGEAVSRLTRLRVSPQKLNLVAATIRGKAVDRARADLQFSRKRIAADVLKALDSAIANAENNYNLNVDRLMVRAAWVGKSLVMRRIRPGARGRARRIGKPFSNLTIVVTEQQEAS